MRPPSVLGFGSWVVSWRSAPTSRTSPSTVASSAARLAAVVRSERRGGCGVVAGRTLYRIVKTNPPTRRDFLSNQARRGDPKPDLPPAVRRLWDGISVHETELPSRRQAQETPWTGGFIAELRISEQTTAPVHWERTILGNEGHHTLWGNLDELLSLVTRVVSVAEARQ